MDKGVRQWTKQPQTNLDPMEHILEVLFGLIMALTFTGSLSVAKSGNGEVRTMLAGALGCNIAWGLIDAIMYLMAGLAEKIAQSGLPPPSAMPRPKLPTRSSPGNCRRLSPRPLMEATSNASAKRLAGCPPPDRAFRSRRVTWAAHLQSFC